MAKPTTLYRAFDAEDVLLYVGVAAHWARRFAAHERYAEWFRLIVRVELVYYETRADALAAEYEAITCEHPAYNETPGWKPEAIERLERLDPPPVLVDPYMDELSRRRAAELAEVDKDLDNAIAKFLPLTD